MNVVPWIDWYQSLAKPSWTPVPQTIRLIWQILYPVIIATFGYVFVQAGRGRLPLLVALPFVINLVANLIYTPIQFGTFETVGFALQSRLRVVEKLSPYHAHTSDSTTALVSLRAAGSACGRWHSGTACL